MILISSLNFIVHSINGNINLHDGRYFINMGPGWIWGGNKACERGSIIIPPNAAGSFTKFIKYEDIYKVMVKQSADFDYKFISGSLSLGVGREWGKEITLEQTLEYEDNPLFTYVKIYAIANRYEIITVKNNRIIDQAIGYTGSGIWGKRLDFDPNTPITQELLDEPFDKSFITDGKSNKVKLYTSSIILSKDAFKYNNKLFSLSISNVENTMFCALDSPVNGIYKFQLKRNICKKIVVYKSLDKDFLEYITSIDDFDFDITSIQLELEKDQKYFFKLIDCKAAKISIVGKPLTTLDTEVNNNELNMNNRTFFQMPEIDTSSNLYLKRNNEFIEKEIFYGCSIATIPNISKKKLVMHADNCFYEISIYRDENITEKYNLKNKTLSIDISPEEYFVIGVKCKSINNYNFDNELNGIRINVE